MRRPGFTLLEMLVAMTLLAFIVVAGQQAIALAARGAAPRGDGGHAFHLRHQILDWLETTLPIRSDRRDRAPLIFFGEPAALRFVTSLPSRFGVAGPHIVTLSRAPGGLLMSWMPLRLEGGRQLPGRQNPGTPPGERLLLEGANLISFRYWDSASGWRDTWPPGQRLPELIEFSAGGGAAAGWQPIVVAPRNR